MPYTHVDGPGGDPMDPCDATPEAYETTTGEARRLGIFGVPTFVTRGELFWGDERLEDAIRWSQSD